MSDRALSYVEFEGVRMREMRSDISGSDKLTSLFGYWPSFHDAEVIDITLRRGTPRSSPTLTATIHAFQMTNEVSSRGQYVCHHHCIVTLHFIGVKDLELNGFNQQNALMDLAITNISERTGFEVHFKDAFGVQATFLCSSVHVASVEQGIPEGSMYAQPTNPGDVSG